LTDIILASGSPRRKELLEQIHLPFTVETSEVEEIVPHEMNPEQTVMYLASIKAKAVAEKRTNHLVIGADTVVVLDGRILGKPRNRDHAREMLMNLSGKTHTVYTGVAIIQEKQETSFFEKTDVTFWELEQEEIEGYLDSGEPFDKAGAYGIQGIGAVLVKEIKGDYFSVVGLPIAALYHRLKEMGYQPSFPLPPKKP